MNLTLKIQKSDDFEKMGALVSGMRNVMLQKQAENSLISDTMWREFIASLVESAEPGFYWTVALKEKELPPDESVEFTRFPTAIALAALALDQQLYPGTLSEEGKVLFQNASEAFSLQGFGEDALFQICEILLILGEGRVYPFLETWNNSALLGQMNLWKEHLKQKIDSGNTLLPYGGDYRGIFETILKSMEG